MTINRLEQQSWDDVRMQVKQVNPKLAEIIDNLSLDSSFRLYKGTYSFGQEILKRAQFQVPLQNNHPVDLNDPRIDRRIQEDLNYNFGSIPASLILSGTTEVFMNIDDYTIPFIYGALKAGKVFRTWKVLGHEMSHAPIFIWNMTSGARSLFMLAKISKATSHKKLMKKFNLQAETPKGILQHWHVFKELANHPEFATPWHSEVLFFTKKWFDHIHDPAFAALKLYLLEEYWKNTNYWRNQVIWDLVFSLIQKETKTKTSSHITHIVKHLIAMSVGALSGYAPAIDNTVAPIQALKNIYANVYHLEYEPIIMQPHSFSLNEDRPVYFSFEYPTALEFANKSRADSSKLNDLLFSQSLLKKYLEKIKDAQFNLKNTPIYDVDDLIKFDFYHTNPENFSRLKNSKDIHTTDSNFNITDDNADKFPSNSAFLRGCVQILKK